MKNFLFTVIAMMFLVACGETQRTTELESNSEGVQQPASQTPMDTTKARQELNTLVDEIHSLFKKKDIAFVDKYMAKDGIYLGTDPNEILSFDDFRAYHLKEFNGTEANISDYKISRREIVIHGTSAIIIDQLLMPEISEKVMLRNISHARHENGRWVIDMYAWNFIPKNEDVQKIDKAL